jgi:hypothetical protein
LTDFAPIYPGWNVWGVYQVKDLDFSIPMIGVSRDTQLRIWAEDLIRLNAPGATVADPLDFKGSKVEILHSRPSLEVAARKEDVPGPAMLLDGPADLRYVRFYNRGAAAALLWPRDPAENYVLNEVFLPSKDSPATNGPGPDTIGSGVGGGVGSGVAEGVSRALVEVSPFLILAGMVYILTRKEG